MWCKKCNIETNANTCPICGEQTVEDIPVEIYWCKHCHAPIIQSLTQANKGVCPICKRETKYLSTDLRPVFPEERLLVELLLGKKPFEWMEKSVWASNNRLTIAVDKYDPDTSGAFASYATLWILQNISREQSTRRPLVYYPVHQKENYFSMYPILKIHGCIECDDLWKCEKARQMVMDKLDCSDKDAERTIAQMIPDSRIKDLLNLYSGDYSENDDVMVGSMLGSISPDIVVSDEDALQAMHDKILGEVVADALKKLTPREEEILKLRYGFDGPEQTLEQVGSRYNITRERIRQIEAKALRKLRHLNLIESYIIAM